MDLCSCGSVDQASTDLDKVKRQVLIGSGKAFATGDSTTVAVRARMCVYACMCICVRVVLGFFSVLACE